MEGIVLVLREGETALEEVHTVLEVDSSRDRGIGIGPEEGSIDQPWEEADNILEHQEVVHILRMGMEIDPVGPVLWLYSAILDQNHKLKNHTYGGCPLGTAG